jgi:hypothetical protein
MQTVCLSVEHVMAAPSGNPLWAVGVTTQPAPAQYASGARQGSWLVVVKLR